MTHTLPAQLKDIAVIRLGYPFRSSIENIRLDAEDLKGLIGVIQMKDFDPFNRLGWQDVYNVQIENLDKTHLLQLGDILFRSRGVSNTAALVTEEMQQVKHVDQFVASAALMVIQVKTNRVDPAYLCWYINHSQGQRQLSRLAKGTNQQMISKAALESFTVELPSLERQQFIGQLAALSQREQEILSELTQKRKEYSDTALRMLAQGSLNLEKEGRG